MTRREKDRANRDTITTLRRPFEVRAQRPARSNGC